MSKRLTEVENVIRALIDEKHNLVLNELSSYRELLCQFRKDLEGQLITKRQSQATALKYLDCE